MFNDSSVVTMSSAQPDQYFASSHYASSTAGQSPSILTNPFTPNASIPPTPGSLAGRKRSRGDIFAEDEIEPDGSLPTPAEEPREPVMGSGITLVYPDQPGYGNTAESQSAMDIESRTPFKLQHASRPSMSSRKSQRRDNATSSSDELAQLVMPSTLREATAEPLIDEATRVLGISWIRMDSTEALLINQAAYNKFIQNHYPSLKDVTVWFENCALPGYLVVATNAYTDVKEFYIFSHDLLEARLVTREPADLLPRLQLLPALELAAPAGHIRAETDSATASQNEVNTVLAAPVEEARGRTQEQEAPQGREEDAGYRHRELLCAAHEMELD